MNTICLIGTLTRAPTVRFEGEGVQVCTFTLRVQEATREGKPWVLYAPCVSYGKAADQASLLSAEDLISVQGKLSWRKQAHKCGQEHSGLVVQAREISVLQGAAVTGTEDTEYRDAGA